jgi:hypothetical protein
LLNNFSQSIRRHIDSGFLSLTYDVRAEAARHPDLREVLVNKDLQIQERIVDLMASTDLAHLSKPELGVRAEQVCLLFEGVVARIGRRTDFDLTTIDTLLRPLLTAVLTLDEPERLRAQTACARVRPSLSAEGFER